MAIDEGKIARPNTYPLDIGLKGVTAYITVMDATEEPDTRNNGQAFATNNNERQRACIVFGEGTVNRIPVTFEISYEWGAKWDEETKKYDRTRQALRRNQYSRVWRADGNGYNDAPENTRSKVTDAGAPAAEAFLAEHAHAVREARSIALRNKVEGAERARDEAYKAYKEAEETLRLTRAMADAWEEGRRLPYNVTVTSRHYNRGDFEKTYKVMAHSPAEAARLAFEQAQKVQPAEEHETRYAKPLPLF